ncbi:M56 family metallopeptidase [Polaribacter litorisediminis]|uniref:M56 family metallopeptidase n=1 Tax=Polaribacter litorisediminis TaxID=1908341 RepID=UPI001CBEB626|nr:M56 family metallopeptidase [Polaribacter litorisediminis]UAM96877.1 M56 family metallopeptidase [Polaribacter litorisediminis]
MIAYFLKSAGCLALLLFFYHLILEKEKMHSFNRFYLLIGVIVSLIIPFATLTVEVPAISTSEITTFEPTFTTEETLPILVEETIDYTKYIFGVYVIISILLFFRFGRNLFKIIQKIRLHTHIKLENASLVLVDDPILPHTFWNFIFINKTDYKNGKIEEELFTHELTHVTQKHTIDVLLIEFLQAIFWINPLFIFLKKAMQLNHEFLADENVINQHKNTFHYQHILVNKAAWNNEYYLASNLNYSLTKKRLKMMTTQSSKTKIWLKKLAVIPLLAGFVFLFAERVEAQEVIEEVKPKNSNELLIFLKKDKKLKINNDILILSDLKEEIDQKITNIKNAYIVLEAEANSNLKKQFIEEIRIELSKSGIYQISFKNFTLSPNSDVIKLKGKREINEIRKRQVEEVVISKEYIDSPIPTNSFSIQSIPSNNNGTITDIRLKLQDVNALKINYTKDSIKFNKDWYITIDNQKYYYTFDKNERIARYYKNGKLVNLDIIKEYKRKQQTFENLKSTGKHYVFKTEKEQKEIDQEFSDLGGMYFRMSRADKNKVSRPINPRKPYITLRKNNKVFYKLRKDLTEEDKLLLPPPPPKPNATKEEVLKSKKAYKDWKKRTGNDGAPPPPKTNNKQENSFTSQLKKISKKSQNNDGFLNNKNNSDNEFYVAQNQYTVYDYSKPTNKAIYYVDGKEIAFKNLISIIKPYEIESTRVEKNKDGSKNVYITSKPGADIKNSTNKVKNGLKDNGKLNEKVIDLSALEVIEKRTEKGGIYFHYTIKNTGNTIIPKKSYQVYLKVDGKTISFDKATANIKPGQVITYKSQKTFYESNKKQLNYTLNIKFKDDHLDNNILKGISIFDKDSKEVPSGFFMKYNEKENLSLTSVAEVEREKESKAKFSDEEKKQFDYRKLLLKTTTMNPSKFNFKINDKNYHINDAYTFIHKHPFSNIDTRESPEGILTILLNKNLKNKMSYDDLQNVYTNIFQKIK